MNHIISKREKKRMFLEIKENKSYIFNPMGVWGFHGVSQFSALYDSYTNCDDIMRKSSSDFQKSICPVIDEIKKELISIECYGWDYDTIYQYANEHGYLNPFYEASDSVCDKIISVNEDLEA